MKFPFKLSLLSKECVLKSKKRQQQKSEKAEARKRHGRPGAGNSKYALKHKAQAKGIFSDTSPLRFGKEVEE